jgi:hypothetical protein
MDSVSIKLFSNPLMLYDDQVVDNAKTVTLIITFQLDFFRLGKEIYIYDVFTLCSCSLCINISRISLGAPSLF